MNLVQERDHCLVAVSGDGTISITDLRKMKVAAGRSLMRLMVMPERSSCAITLHLHKFPEHPRRILILKRQNACPVPRKPSLAALSCLAPTPCSGMH